MASDASIMTPPGTYDPSVTFPWVVIDEVWTQYSPLPLLDFDFKVWSVGSAAVQAVLQATAWSLASCGCDLVMQVGTPIAWAGLDSEDEVRIRQAMLEHAAGTRVIMNSIAIIEALRALGARKVALVPTYYDAEWRDAFARFVGTAGFVVLYAKTLYDQGIVTSDDITRNYGWRIPPDLTVAAAVQAYAEAPEADAIVVVGTANRTLTLIKDIEMRTGRPLVAADTAAYWAVARKLRLGLKPGVLGRLGTT